MKLLLKILFAVSVAFFTTSASAEIDAGRDSANYYKTFPDKWDENKISIDCVSAKRINGGPQVEGVVFFGAQTIDDKNKAPGGGIVVAVLEGDVESFVRKYGTESERTQAAPRRSKTNA